MGHARPIALEYKQFTSECDSRVPQNGWLMGRCLASTVLEEVVREEGSQHIAIMLQVKFKRTNAIIIIVVSLVLLVLGIFGYYFAGPAVISQYHRTICAALIPLAALLLALSVPHLDARRSLYKVDVDGITEYGAFGDGFGFIPWAEIKEIRKMRTFRGGPYLGVELADPRAHLSRHKGFARLNLALHMASSRLVYRTPLMLPMYDVDPGEEQIIESFKTICTDKLRLLPMSNPG